ncbi:MAG: lipoate--protein ligase [Bacteroidota bacterium]|nr:lipoate--protein ligase [Bacteroidota bacterium]
MLCITNNTNNPYFNIAAEEYLLRNFSDDIFMLYRNTPSIIVGKHQNTFAELNYWFVKEHNIDVVRRLSGGGTVFHDAGNLNFTFIRNGEEGNLVDFRRFTQPILDVLHQLGVPAEHSGRNDLIINGLKFSGNAEHVYKKRILHHGTLLFSSQLGDLREALKVNPEQYLHRGVQSVRSKVTNISEHLPAPIAIDTFQDKIINYIVSQNTDCRDYFFSEADNQLIQQLVNEKYSTWDWNFGYSPRFVFSNKGIVENKPIEVELEIEKGKILRAALKIDGNDIPGISDFFSGTVYREESVERIIRGLGLPASALRLFF